MALKSRPSTLTRLRRDGERAAAQFPALLAEAERIAASIAHGVHGRREPGSGETFWEYRHYRNEDSAQRIDWRRSARGDHLFVRETEREAANAVFLWADGSAGMRLPATGSHTKRERAAVCLIAMASLLVRGGERVAAFGAGRARSGRVGLERSALELADGAGDIADIEAPELPRHARIVLASDFLDPPETWQARLSRLSRHGTRGVLLRIIDPSEEDFPFKGRTRFKDSQGGSPVLFGRAEDIQTAYQDRWHDHGAHLADMARRSGFLLISHRIDKPAASAVMALYQALAGDRS